MLLELPENIIALVVNKLVMQHPVTRQKPEIKRDAIALCHASKATLQIGLDILRIIADYHDPAEYISLGIVSKTFLLKPKDRRDIPTKVFFKYYDRSKKWPVVTWSRHHVVMKCLEKFGGESGYEREIRRLHTCRMKRKRIQDLKKNARRKTMENALHTLGCSLRDDSSLCNDFIDHGKGDPDKIAIIMCEMKFFYEHTNYAEEYDIAKHAELEWNGRYDKAEVSASAKINALFTWANNFQTLEEARARPELPVSLSQRLTWNEFRNFIDIMW